MWLLTLSLALFSAFPIEEKATSHLSDFALTDAANIEASRSLLSAGLGMTLFVNNCDLDQTFAIDVPQDGTIRDIVHKIQEVSGSQRQSNVLWQGKQMSPSHYCIPLSCQLNQYHECTMKR